MRSLTTIRRPYLNVLVFVLVFILATYVLLPQIGSFKSSWHLLRNTSHTWVIIAATATLITYFSAAGTYYYLALKPMKYLQLTLIQLAAMFINRLLPAGIGALGANYEYLRHKKHSEIQAVSIVTINNFLGLIGHVMVLIVSLILFRNHANFNLSKYTFSPFLIAIGAIALIIVFGLTAVFLKKRFLNTTKIISKQLKLYKKKPDKLLMALLCSMSLTSLNVFAFEACSVALGLHINFLFCVLIFGFGIGVGTATPTPGGLGGIEAGMFAGLVAYRVPYSSALALVLLYRLVSYWSPLIIGGFAFVSCQKQKLFATAR